MVSMALVVNFDSIPEARPAQDSATLGSLFAESAAIMAKLRAPGGCPWDREQTPDSIRKYTLEETYEVLDAIERRDWPNLCEELGDLLLQVLFYAEMAEEARDFRLSDVLVGLNRKLIRRHPHVFGAEASARAGNQATDLAPVADAGQNGSDSVKANWRAIKEFEKKSRQNGQGAMAGCLAEVTRAQPALSEAARLGAAAARVGFDWPDPQGLLEKIREEAVEAELLDSTPAEPQSVVVAESGIDAKSGKPGAPETLGTLGREQSGAVHDRLAEEFGDLLFTVANLGRHLRLDPEMALRDANAKFRRRFQAMEQTCEHPLQSLTPAELEQVWARIKQAEARY